MLTRRNLLKAVPALGALSLLPSFASTAETVKEDLGKLQDVWFHYGCLAFTKNGLYSVAVKEKPFVELLYTRGIKVFQHNEDFGPITFPGQIPDEKQVLEQLEKHSEYLEFCGTRFELFSTGIYCELNQTAELTK